MQITGAHPWHWDPEAVGWAHRAGQVLSPRIRSTFPKTNKGKLPTTAHLFSQGRFTDEAPGAQRGVNCPETQTQEGHVGWPLWPPACPFNRRLIPGNWCLDGALGQPWGEWGAGLEKLGCGELARRAFPED